MSAQAGRCPRTSRRFSRTGARRAPLAALAAAMFTALLASSPAAAQAAAPAVHAAVRAVAPAAVRAAVPATSPAWSVRTTVPNPVTSLTGIACPAAKTCYSVGILGMTFDSNIYGGAVKTSDGSTWTTQSLPLTRAGLPAVDLTGVVCPSVNTCYAVGAAAGGGSAGAVMSTTDGGTAWALSLPSAGVLHGVACPSASVCYAVGSNTSATGGQVLAT